MCEGKKSKKQRVTEIQTGICCCSNNFVAEQAADERDG